MKWLSGGLLCVFAACTAAHRPELPADPYAIEADPRFVKTDRLGTRTCFTATGSRWPDLLPRGALALNLGSFLEMDRRSQDSQDSSQCRCSLILLLLNEASMLPLAPDSEVYRFTWIPSFHANRIIRVERRGNVYSLHVKVEGNDEGALATDRRILLTPTQWQALQQRLEQARFWSQVHFSSPLPYAYSDGATWLFEGGRSGRYRALDIHSPNRDGLAGPFYELGAFLLELSGIPMTEYTLY
ncbi:hypothetical protein [Corallococcus exiguus]|uniref:Lipoprotein n=1 Tax=Corallococcus exiguus TaxID=83462 RepID=A0A7X5BT64_9BACT|nr:hypothetical protein [Corallococcus exiguus]NBC40918.1 hypothetical protein [Corallococcus exiguus]TNV64866.1 hypothetical protein FH620_11375 [Corallococcus exiguus]